MTYTTFKEVYEVRYSAANTTKKALMPKHLVISNVIDHLAQKNLLEKVLTEDQKATYKAVKTLVESMGSIN